MALESNKEEQFEMDEEVAVKQKLNPDSDSASPSKVKFINDSKNGEAKVDVDNGYGGSVGMSKEELMKYANDPFWVRLRMFLFVLFWVVWFSMLIGAIVIVALAPKCPATSSLPWWQKTSIYQVYVRSFKDSNADGEGDLNGLISKLDYFKDLGIETLILSPIYPSAMKDHGYDVTNYLDIDQRYGTLDDFDKLVDEMHSDSRQMKLIIDFIPNHTSDQHPWFNASKNGDPVYKDFYVWHNGTTDSNGERKEPNNWRSVFDGSAWTWNEQRQQYYLHQFLSSQPDLNLRNPDVKQSLKEVLQFWLKRKVDGFRIDAATHLIEDESFEDEKLEEQHGVRSDYNATDHSKTKGQPESFELIKEWRKIVKQSGLKKILLSESYEPTQQLLKYYGQPNEPLVDLPFNFDLIEIGYNTNATQIRNLVTGWLKTVADLGWPPQKPPAPWSAFVSGNHDKSRLSTRIGQRLSEAIQMLLFIIPRNTPVVYYGDEIGLKDNYNIPTKTRVEGELSRIAYRSPMHWTSNGSTAGFSDTDDVWVFPNEEFGETNVEAQLKKKSSHLSNFRSLVNLRKSGAEAIILGQTKFPEHEDLDNVFVMARLTDVPIEGQKGYLLAINFNTNTVKTVKLKESYLPDKARVILTNSENAELDGSDISLSELTLQPQQSILVDFNQLE